MIPGATPDFLSPEWGIVTPFALTLDDATSYYRGDQEYRVFHDPGQPPRIDITQGGGLSNEYKWNFAMVSVWGAHCDPADSVMINISPASFGNNPIENYPTTIEGLRDFYAIDADHIVLAALDTLRAQGKVDPERAADWIAANAIDADAIDPAGR